MYIPLLGVVIILEICNYVCCISIEKRIEEYYSSGPVSSFQDDWTKHMVSFESAIANTLQDSYGYGLLNVFMTGAVHSELLTHGFLISDNSVDVLCYDMNLTEFPRLLKPSVNFALASNVLRLESPLSKILVETDYLLFRNSSEILGNDAAQDPSKVSPFTFQQVQKTGHLAITAEDCALIGTIIVTLTGPSISFGHDTLRLADCKFTVEISAIGLGSPPVIAPFLSKEKSGELMLLMSKPIRYALLPKLQGVVFSLLNTTDLFETRLFQYRPPQQALFRATSDYFSDFVRRINDITMDSNQGVLPLEDFAIAVDDKGKKSNIQLTGMTLSGLDTIYSSNKGGAYQLKDYMLSEEIDFNALYVKGKFILDNEGSPETHDFAAELKDLSVNVIFTIQNSKLKLQEIVSFCEMRALDYAIIQDFKQSDFRPTAHALLSGYLTNRVPKVITEYLNKVVSKELGISKKLALDIPGGLDGVTSYPYNPQNNTGFTSSGESSDLNKPQNNPVLDRVPSDSDNSLNNPGIDGGLSDLDNVQSTPGFDDVTSDPDNPENTPGLDGGPSDTDNPLNNPGLDGVTSDPDNPENTPGLDGGPSDPDNPQNNPELDGGPSDPDNPQNNPELDGGPSDPDNPQNNPELDGGPSDPDNPQNNPELDGGPSDPDNPQNNPELDGGPSDPDNPQNDIGIDAGPSEPDNPQNYIGIDAGPSEPDNPQSNPGSDDVASDQANSISGGPSDSDNSRKRKLIIGKSDLVKKYEKMLKNRVEKNNMH